jgi:hypothetical protein
MTMKFYSLIAVIVLASVAVGHAQSPTPAESPAQSPAATKHRAARKAKAAASPTTAAASTAASPAASPATRRGRRKAAAAAAASPVVSPTPGKFNLGDLFKPKTSTEASPSAATSAPAKSTGGQLANRPAAAGGGHGLVWVNTETHIYHREGSRFYGRTKKGKYVTEADAIKEGDKAAGKGE